MKRLLYSLALSVVAAGAYAGPITVTNSYFSSGSNAYSSDSGSFGFGFDEFGFAPGYRYTEAFAYGSTAYAYNSGAAEVYSDGSFLAGYSQSYGYTTAENGSSYQFGSTIHWVEFSLSSRSNVSVYLDSQADGYLDAGINSSGSIYSGSSVALYDSFGNSIAALTDNSSFNASGYLDAGTYYFVASSYVSSSTAGLSAGSGANSYGYYQLQAEAVPEPATMAVLGLGAAALLRRRRK